jgi:hypothetical protein
MDYFKTWKEVMLRPSDYYRKMPTTGGYSEPLTFAAISYIISGLLTVILIRGLHIGDMYGVDSSEFSFSMLLASVIMTPIAGIIYLLIGAAIFYIIYKLLGGTGSYEGTVRFMSYASAILVVSWIPLLNLITWIYGIYLYIVGGAFVHNVSMGKSTLAILLPYILAILLAIILAAFIASFVLSHFT